MAKKRKPRSKKTDTNIIKEVTTTEVKEKGSWTKIIQVKYIKQLLCPAFLDTNILTILASVPLLFLIIVVLWRMFYYE